jgi:hypothetical protein
VNISNERVQRALDAEDVEGLLQMGAPPDEYEHEAKMIGERLRATNGDLTEGAIAVIIAAVWTEQFGVTVHPEFTMAVSSSVARRILREV